MAPPVKDVSVAQFADLLGVTTARVYQFIQEGMPHRKRGQSATRIIPREAIAWRVQKAVDAATPTEPKSLRPRDRKETAEAELKELDVLERRRALIPMEDFEAFVDALVGGFAATASGRLQRFEREIVAATSPGEARKVTEEIHRALMAGAQEYRAQLEDEASALEADEAAEGTEPESGVAA